MFNWTGGNFNVVFFHGRVLSRIAVYLEKYYYNRHTLYNQTRRRRIKIIDRVLFLKQPTLPGQGSIENNHYKLPHQTAVWGYSY